MVGYLINRTCNVTISMGTLNYSDPTKAEDAEHNFGETLVNSIILPCLMVSGMIFNITFLIVVIRIPWMRNITNLYLTNLCIADITFLLAGVLDKLSRHLVSPVAGDQYIYQMYGCILVYLTINTAHFAALFFITLITFERYYIVCRPLHRRLLSSSKTSMQLTGAAWGFALVFAAGMVPSTRNFLVFCVIWPEEAKYTNFPPVVGHCLAIRPWIGLLANAIQTIPFFLALIINSVLYIKIFKRLDTMVDHRRDSNAPLRQVKLIRIQISRMLIANGVVFFICVTPWTVYSLVFEVLVALDPDTNLSIPAYEIILLACRTLLYCNSVANPLMFNFASQRHRKAFLDTFAICKKMRTFYGRRKIVHTVNDDILLNVTVNTVTMMNTDTTSW